MVPQITPHFNVLLVSINCHHYTGIDSTYTKSIRIGGLPYIQSRAVGKPSKGGFPQKQKLSIHP